MSETMPFVIVIFIAFLLRNLINNNELISIRNLGLSIMDVFKPIGMSILLFGLINLIFINPIAAKFEKEFDILTSKNYSDIYSIKLIDKQLWIKNITDKNSKKIMNISNINLDNMRANKIKIFENENLNNKIIIAEKGKIQNKNFVLENVKIFNLENDKITKKDLFNIKLNFDKSSIIDSISNYKFIPFYKYYQHVNNLKKFNLNSPEVSLYYISEILKPFFLVMIGFVVMSFSGKFKRNESFFKVLFISILIGFLIFLHKEIVITVTTNINISYILSYLIIFIFPFFIGLYKMINIETD
jgi:Predicted permeases